jgi:hypothetical protein
MVHTDKNGNKIEVGHELNVPLDVFSNGLVILDKDSKLALELRFESKTIPIGDLNKHVLEILN